MELITSHSFLMLSLSVALLLTVTNVSADDASEESTMTRAPIVVDSNETEEDAIARQSTHLCLNVVGCNCDKELKEATCNCPNSIPSRLRFSNFQIPKSIETIHILDCEYVPINHPGLSELHLKELTIKSVNQVMIGPKTLKRVDKLVIENVNEFELEPFALDSLESDSVKIINATFSSMSAKEIKPKLIKEELLLHHSTLPSNLAIYLTEPAIQQTAPSLVIEGCVINTIKMGVNVTSFQMINNRFQMLPVKHSLNIHYTKYVWLTGNILKGETTFPEVNSKQLIGKSEVQLADNNGDAKTFWNAFVFHFRGDPSEIGTSSSHGRIPNGAIDTQGRTPHDQHSTNKDKANPAGRTNRHISSNVAACSFLAANLLTMTIVAIIIQ